MTYYYLGTTSTTTASVTYSGYSYASGDTRCGTSSDATWYYSVDTCYWINANNGYAISDLSIASEETAKEKGARLARERKAEKERQAIVKRAEELLILHIGMEAFGKLHELGYIETDSQHHKGRKYRVPANHMAYIEVLDEKGRVIDTLCVHPDMECPPADHILTRLIYLKMDEEALLAEANHWGQRERSYY